MTRPTRSRARMPRHVAVIMDGNGRWAERRGLPRSAGHRAGARTVRRVTEEATRLGLDQLTLFVFSTENWRRPKGEVDFLMRLFSRFLRSERRTMRDNDVRLQAIGRLHELPALVQRELADAMRFTRACRGMNLTLAVNYGGRAELADACRRLIADIEAGATASVDEAAIASRLYQPDMPPLDLIVRTGGEMRLSNFLIWQAAYAELYVTPVCWPDFDEAQLRKALADFARRERRFGAVAG